MATYDNDLRLKEITTGQESGTWGTSTNTNLSLIAEALGYGTEAVFDSDANKTTTVADAATDPARSMYYKVTSSATLSATRELTIAPNSISRVMWIENATTGSQTITIKQGSGATVDINTGKTKIVYLDGAGSSAAVVDALSLVDTSGSIGLDSTVRTSAFTAVKNNSYMIDTSSGTFDITLPASPAVGDKVGFMDVESNFDVNAATLLRNSSKLFNAASDGTIDIKGYAGVLVYTGSTYGWMPMF
tara:strand:- start:139 stop:876 length:738 start_codon:yes stop_codon:yes gene_type:complete